MSERRRQVTLACKHCARSFEYGAAEYKYRRKYGAANFFCSRACVGAYKTCLRWLPKAEKVARKAAYDRLYRERNREKLRAAHAAYHLRTYDPVRAREERKGKMAAHAEYCRRYYADPTRKAAKVEYDAVRRSAKYGPFADAHRLLMQLNRELIRRSPDKYERLKARGYYQRGAQTMRRNAQVSRW